MKMSIRSCGSAKVKPHVMLLTTQGNGRKSKEQVGGGQLVDNIRGRIIDENECHPVGFAQSVRGRRR